MIRRYWNPNRWEKRKKLREQRDLWPDRFLWLLTPLALVCLIVFLAVEVFKVLFLGDA